MYPCICLACVLCGFLQIAGHGAQCRLSLGRLMGARGKWGGKGLQRRGDSDHTQLLRSSGLLGQPPGHLAYAQELGHRMVWLVLEAPSPGQQTEMTPESNCFNSGPRIQSGKLRPEARRLPAPAPIAKCARIIEMEWGGNSTVTWSNSMNYFSLHLS